MSMYVGVAARPDRRWVGTEEVIIPPSFSRTGSYGGTALRLCV